MRKRFDDEIGPFCKPVLQISFRAGTREILCFEVFLKTNVQQSDKMKKIISGHNQDDKAE